MTDNTKIKKLFEFCTNGDRIGLADYIITNKCYPSAYDARDSNGQTALHIACQHGHLFVVRSLIEIFGCNNAITDKFNNVPLHIACLNGHLSIVDYLFTFIEDEDITNAILTPDSEGNNLLHKACHSGSVCTVRYILHALCYPKKKLLYRKLNLYEDSVTVYDAASSAILSTAQVKSLVQCAAKPNNLGENAVHVACHQGHLMVLKLFEAFFPYNGLFEFLTVTAIQCNHTDIIDYLGALYIQKEPIVDFNSETPQTRNITRTIFLSGIRQYEDHISYVIHKLTCKSCHISFEKQYVQTSQPITTLVHCPSCEKKNQHLYYEFQCEFCSTTFTDNEIVKIKCSKCNRSKIKLAFISKDSVIKYQKHHMITHFSSIYGHEPPPFLFAALQGDMKLYRQVHSRFPSSSKSVLHAACISDNVNLVKHIMDTLNISVNDIDVQGNTPLHVVCKWGSWNVFLHLLSFSELDMNIINNENQTIFFLACKYSKLKFVKKLLEHNINYDRNALYIVCGNGQLDIVEEIIRRWGTETIDCVDKYGDTPLFDACRSRNLELVKFLVAKGFNPLFINETTKDTPVHIACRMNRPDILEALCQSQHIKDKSLESNILGVSPVHLAIENNCFKLVAILLKYSLFDLNLTINEKKVTLAQSAFLVQNVQFLSILLQQPSVDWNAQNGDGNTFLHLACIDNNENIVKMVMQRTSKSITIQNAKKMTPVHIAVTTHNLSLLTMLLQDFSGSLDKYVDEQNNTVLHLACKKQIEEIFGKKIICLLSNFCSVISQNINKETPLHLACKYLKFVQIVDHLLKQLPESCSLDELVDKTGNTILHVAAAAFDFDGVVKCILECNESMILYKTQIGGLTPVHLACRKGFLQIVKLFVSKTVCVEYSTNGDSYLHAACQGKSLDIVKFLLNGSQLDCQSLLVANKEGNTPFHLACSLGCGEIIKFMMSYCVNQTLSLKNCRKLTPFCCLLEHTFIHSRSGPGVVKDFISEKIIDDRWSSDDKPLLHSVIEIVTDHFVFDLIKVIVSREDFDPLKCDSNGNTILHCFANQLSLGKYSQEFHSTLWKYLLKLPGIDVNKQNQNDDTVLHMLCKIQDRPIRSYEYYYHVNNSPPLRSSKLIEQLLVHAESSIKTSLDIKNKQGKSPIQLANKQVMKLLIRYGANPQDVYTEFGPMLDKFRSKHPLKSSMKIIVVGNSTAGKTTLVKALNQLVSKQESDSEVIETECGRTAGMKTSTLESKELGRVTFHDFAGQPEFESSNSAFLENSLSLNQPPIFLLLADVSTNYETLKKHTQYWFTFIQNHFPQQLETLPHVMILGSHSDRIEESQYQCVRQCMKAAIDSICSSTFHTIGPFLLDCRKVGTELQELNKMLAKSCSSLRKTVEVDIRCHILFAYLSTWFGAKQSIKFCHVQEKIRSQSSDRQSPYNYAGQYDSQSFFYPVRRVYSTQFDHSDEFLLPFTTDSLLELLKSLHDGGHIVLLNAEFPKNCWIVMNSRSLFEEVNGKLFAPKFFAGPKLQLKTNTGVVSKDMLTSLFPSIDINLITSYTVYSEFCRKIEDSMTLKLIDGSCTIKSGITSGISDNASYYFFPCLVQCERPTEIWQNVAGSSSSVHTFGWYIQCKADNYLDPRFLYVVLLRLTFTFAATGTTESSSQDTHSDARLVRKCSIWKNGIHWGTTSGLEVLVEVIEQNSAVILLVRNYVGYEMEGIKLRSQIINMILETKDEFCPKTKITEYILKECSIYPSDDVSKKISICDIAHSIIKNAMCVLDSKNRPLMLKDLLFFDPYLEIGQNLIEQLWSEQSSEEEIPSRFLMELSEAQRIFVKQIIKLLEILQSEVDTYSKKWEKEPVKLLLHIYESWKSKQDNPCFENLRKIFNSYSIFSGRNPLEIVSLDYSQNSDQQPEGDKPHPNCSMYESENATLQCKSEDSQHTSTLLFAETSLDSVSLKHLMCITWMDAETERKLHILRDASISWRKIAETVHMPQDMISALNCETRKPPQDCACDVFKWWISQSSTKRYNKTWEGLHLLLNDSGLPGLAQKIYEAIISPENSVFKLNPLKSKSNTKRVSHQRRKRRLSGASNC